MGQGKKLATWRRRRQAVEEEIPGNFNWSELCPDLLRCVFKRLSFTALSRAKSVCSSWHSASRGCVPNRNQIPWLVLFPRNEETNKESSCVLFVPDDTERVYKTRDLGLDFFKSRCLATCGSWLLMSSPLRDLYMLNPLTGERTNLPVTQYLRADLKYERACFWIDNKTKDYLVIWNMAKSSTFIKKRDNKWHEFPMVRWNEDLLYNHKDQKLYVYNQKYCSVTTWDFSGDGIPREVDEHHLSFWFNHYDFPSWLNEEDDELYWEKLVDFRTRVAVSVSGDVLGVACIKFSCKTWHFRIYKHVNGERVKIDSLGDESLIYDIGITVFAKDIPGIKRNSIYFSGLDHGREDPGHIFVYDLTTQKMEPLPQRIFSSIQFSDARWFFPC
ncbi:hypothetical protein EUTSA_v10015550mg [Eutrema salsugineum]|uniref:F-box domain-containing protein n=1 Tax=Eutrema salsugineum TaxID=72664 RepID=V4KTJ9_EUTSA|nr:F-box protein At2g05970 [Eutrema salsugineum]ESQ41280.1 hypothetical protein EUTSA_v10015550mg [Eutrema salsugineum]